VLIDIDGDNAPMLSFLIITALLLAGVVAAVAGVDSRIDEVSRRRFGR